MRFKFSKIFKNEKGATLLELLVYIIILSILLTTFASLFFMGLRVYRQEFKNSTLQMENRFAMDRIVKDTKNSFKIESSYDVYTTDNTTTLILNVPAIDINDNALYETNGNFKADRIIYKKTANILERIVAADPLSERTTEAKQIASNINNFDLTYYPNITTPTGIKVDLISEQIISNRTITINNSSKVSLRND